MKAHTVIKKNAYKKKWYNNGQHFVVSLLHVYIQLKQVRVTKFDWNMKDFLERVDLTPIYMMYVNVHVAFVHVGTCRCICSPLTVQYYHICQCTCMYITFHSIQLTQVCHWSHYSEYVPHLHGTRVNLKHSALSELFCAPLITTWGLSLLDRAYMYLHSGLNVIVRHMAKHANKEQLL